MLHILKKRLSIILDIYILELAKFMTADKLAFLSNKENLEGIIKFSSQKAGAWCTKHNIFFSSCMSICIDELKKSPLYASCPNHSFVNKYNFLENDFDYIDYIEHLTLVGGDTLDFYLDVLPHEAMHLIGISGGIIGEGVTEKLTRELCLKHNIRCAPILHSKEVKLINMMENLVGKNLLIKAGFLNSSEDSINLANAINEKCGAGSFEEIIGSTQAAYYENYVKKRTKIL